MEEGPLVPSSMPNFTTIGATCRRCGAKKPQNRLLSNLNTGRCSASNAAGKNEYFHIPTIVSASFASVNVINPPLWSTWLVPMCSLRNAMHWPCCLRVRKPTLEVALTTLTERTRQTTQHASHRNIHSRKGNILAPPRRFCSRRCLFVCLSVCLSVSNFA